MSVIERFQHEDLEAIRVGRFNLGVNTSFIVYRLGETVIDTGPSNQWRFLKPFIAEKPLEQLLITHHHEDHAGNIGRISQMTGVTPLAPELSLKKLRDGYATPLMQKLVWGYPGKAEAKPLPASMTLGSGEAVEAIFAPGHARDMTCYLLPERGWLFSADLYIANYLKMLRADEDISILLESTLKVLEYDFELICCPHRGLVKDGKTRLREKYDYIINLAGKVQAMHQKGVPVTEISDQILGKESFISLLSGYNFSKRNLVKSCLEVKL
ncbi:MBL fold metallo-hydrolase [Endozoicomonas arenosclerae]|uniref:MBL fold metallo-hydrolase n=1 Tax=Endozoicomonas arenosclerae TaxID=1633495 RepID=UPI0007835571|nr:MBL fold metallo-hydrolase [Endozoicomonas arenosclerae]